MHRKILETIREFIREHDMLVPGDRVIIGLSGGADSVCLLMILSELKKELNIELFAVHVHHGLRGKEADRDSAYAQELSENLGVPFVCVHANVAEYARVNGVSEEEAGRHLRYQILEEQRLFRHAAKIAVAHHADDQVETPAVMPRHTKIWELTRMVRSNPLRSHSMRSISERILTVKWWRWATRQPAERLSIAVPSPRTPGEPMIRRKLVQSLAQAPMTGHNSLTRQKS